MATASPSYGTPQALTWTIASKASDTNLLAGFESTVVNWATVDALDGIIGGKFTTGTSPTASRQIEVWVYATYDDTEYTAGAAGSDGALTVTAESKVQMVLAQIIPTHATSDTPYRWVGRKSLAGLFGGVVPKKWGLWFAHNTGVNLNSTAGNHEAYYTAWNAESA